MVVIPHFLFCLLSQWSKSWKRVKNPRTHAHTQKMSEKIVTFRFRSNSFRTSFIPLWVGGSTTHSLRQEVKRDFGTRWLGSWAERKGRGEQESPGESSQSKEKEKREREISSFVWASETRKKKNNSVRETKQKNLASGLEKSRVSKLFGKNSRTNGSSKRQTSCTNHLESRRHVFLLLFYFKICIHVWMIF